MIMRVWHDEAVPSPSRTQRLLYRLWIVPYLALDVLVMAFLFFQAALWFGLQMTAPVAFVLAFVWVVMFSPRPPAGSRFSKALTSLGMRAVVLSAAGWCIKGLLLL